ncbi:uncharacterized protein (DUF924 family) [Mesorhizobium sp. J18]|uniref:DUF924 family protein n=1 Tax=Mesorhizobium sp. J18 TaxID=935263 RepID=UPI00119AE327|nr:DUF924 family protein [Mesorhizobium sp. J18]TWG94873.1 uncharacterized protein (DUF924 family) [Mesorhizobium sp. J18]
MHEGWVDDVLNFWFGELTPEDWFQQKDATDKAIRERFLPLHSDLQRNFPEEAMTDPRTALAAIIVFDQFPRNMFRRTPQAFSTDSLALKLARNAVENGLDKDLSPEERQFLCLPFQHSEELGDQERSVQLFEAIGDEEGIRYAVEHRDIIARFGRFPHRNKALQRKSTEEELSFLEGHEGFGQ